MYISSVLTQVLLHSANAKFDIALENSQADIAESLES